jgi:outer membrane receptor for Fe3+-dicitrate
LKNREGSKSGIHTASQKTDRADKIIPSPRGEKEKCPMNFHSVRHKVFVLCLSMMFLPLTAPCEAKDPPETAIRLEEVVVTATRDREEIRRIPANVSVITAREIEQSGATTMVEVLEKLESVQFRDYSGNGSQAYIDMRGIVRAIRRGSSSTVLDRWPH